MAEEPAAPSLEITEAEQQANAVDAMREIKATGDSPQWGGLLGKHDKLSLKRASEQGLTTEQEQEFTDVVEKMDKVFGRRASNVSITWRQYTERSE